MNEKKIIIKFCGGCNPRYDRVSFFEKLKIELKDFEFVYALAGESQPSEHLIVLCGCPATCPDLTGLVATKTTHIVFEDSQYDDVVSEIINSYDYNE